MPGYAIPALTSEGEIAKLYQMQIDATGPTESAWKTKAPLYDGKALSDDRVQLRYASAVTGKRNDSPANFNDTTNLSFMENKQKGNGVLRRCGLKRLHSAATVADSYGCSSRQRLEEKCCVRSP